MKTERLIAIIMVLLEHEQISAPKLAEMFEVSVRTIYRDIDSLSLAGIPVTTQTGSKGGIRIMKNYKVDKKFFTSSDITSLLIALKSLSNTVSPIELGHTFEKVKTLVPNQFLEEIELKSNQIIIDLTPWTSNKTMQPLLEVIKESMDQHSLLHFTYEDNRGKQTKRIVEPYRLVLKEISWYLQAYCQEKQAFRTFKLSRISHLVRLSHSFEPRHFQPAPLGSKPFFGTEFISITLKVTSQVKDQLTDKFGELSFQHIEGTNQFLVMFPFMEDDYGYNLLLSYGTNCECIQPAHVRAEMKNRIKKLLAVYT